MKPASTARKVHPSTRKGFTVSPEEVVQGSQKPYGKGEWSHEKDLSPNVTGRCEHKVTPAGANIAHQIEKGPMMLDIPNQVWQEDRKRNEAANPDPLAGEDPALLGEQQAHHHRQAEHRHGVLGLEARAREHAKPHPQLLISCLDDADHHIGAPCPEERLEGVHGQDVMEDQVDSRAGRTQGRERLRKTPAPQFARDHSSEPDQHKSGHRRQQMDGEHRGSEDVPRQPGGQRDEGRLVDVSPGEVLTAGHVIQLVAKIPVPVRRQQMQQRQCAGNVPDKGRPTGEPGLLLGLFMGTRLKCGHECLSISSGQWAVGSEMESTIVPSDAAPLWGTQEFPR
jgi:hypothetical protein